MTQFSESELTAAVMRSFEETPSARVKFLMEELVRSLHDFVRKTDLTFDEWGYAIEAKLDPMTPATLIKLDGADGPEFWMTFQNFYVISRYNRSPLYSLAVHQVSQAIAAEVAASR